MQSEGWSINQTSAYYDLISPSTLLNWQRQYKAQGIDALHPKKSGRPPVKVPPSPNASKSAEEMTEKELKEELEYLRAENAVLKKFEALRQEKPPRTKKKPK